MRIIALSFVFGSFFGIGQSNIASDVQTIQESAPVKLAMAQMLLREVMPMGIVKREKRIIPEYLTKILQDSIPIPNHSDVEIYLQLSEIDAAALGGPLKDPISRNSLNEKAKYFVIHDTSTPNFGDQEFPSDINEDTWNHNDVDKIWSKSKKAHVFVGRTGKSTSPVGFDTPWRATKYEFKAPPALAAKGLFIHIELVQPRRAQAGKWAGNDIIAPEHGFTLAQYDRLALLYLTASLRADNWLIPGFHACIDDGIKEAHDDPQNFDLDAFDAALKSLMSAFSSEDETENMNFTQLDSLVLWATYYYVPSVEHDSSGISVLDASENETGFRLSKCDWCNAAIQGTVVITKDGKASTLNYAGRSDTIQYDCRKCALYANYDGYEKTGKVLWTPSSGYGLGVNNYKLVPFKTIAVEEDVIPIGSAVFIPRADGIEFTDSDGNIKVHDGYFFAGDVGSKIAGTHIDVFIGDALVNPFDFVQSNAYKTFKAYIVTDTAIIEELRSLHK